MTCCLIFRRFDFSRGFVKVSHTKRYRAFIGFSLRAAYGQPTGSLRAAYGQPTGSLRAGYVFATCGFASIHNKGVIYIGKKSTPES